MNIRKGVSFLVMGALIFLLVPEADMRAEQTTYNRIEDIPLEKWEQLSS